MSKKGRYADLAQEIKGYKAGKIQLKTTMLSKDGERTTWMESGPEAATREAAAKRLKTIRRELGISQAAMAEALGASVRSVQGWEQGRPIPPQVVILAELLADIPAVRKRLLAA